MPLSLHYRDASTLLTSHKNTNYQFNQIQYYITSSTTLTYFEAIMSMPRNRRESFAAQVINKGSALPTAMSSIDFAALAAEIDDTNEYFSAPFNSQFKPGEMRQLALVAHNHMKPAMKEFIETYSEVLKKFRITGTNTTMR